MLPCEAWAIHHKSHVKIFEDEEALVPTYPLATGLPNSYRLALIAFDALDDSGRLITSLTAESCRISNSSKAGLLLFIAYNLGPPLDHAHRYINHSLLYIRSSSARSSSPSWSSARSSSSSSSSSLLHHPIFALLPRCVLFLLDLDARSRVDIWSSELSVLLDLSVTA